MTDILYVLFTMDVECPGEGSKDAGFTDWELGERAIRGYAQVLARVGWPVTYFVVAGAARKYAALLREIESGGAELGLHIHPQDLGYEGQLGAYDCDEQLEIIEKATELWAEAIGHRPTSFRPGNFSTNDATFPALETLGFTRGSCSAPERKMVPLCSVWTGAPMDAHFTHKANRLLPGDMNFLEVPVTVDWESMIWGGKAPLDFRIEAVDARAHGFTIEKNLRRMVEGQTRTKSLVPFTHNYFDYSSDLEFRTITLKGVIERIKYFAAKYQQITRGTTFAEFRELFS
jgi:peptidoglycan/xylan/chitin deacetylase (PgdA/CDA1 family)